METNEKKMTAVRKKLNEDKITAKELLLFLKKDMNMSKVRYEKFCLRYADRDLSTIIQYLKRYSDNKISPKVAAYLRHEIFLEAEKIRAQRRAVRAGENVWEAFEVMADDSDSQFD